PFSRPSRTLPRIAAPGRRNQRERRRSIQNCTRRARSLWPRSHKQARNRRPVEGGCRDRGTDQGADSATEENVEENTAGAVGADKAGRDRSSARAPRSDRRCASQERERAEAEGAGMAALARVA